MSKITATFVLLALLALTGTASAAQVLPGGALNITISGFARFLAAYGNLDDNIQLENLGNLRFRGSTGSPYSRFDFLNDYQLTVTAQGHHESTGIDYGGLIRFVGDTNFLPNTSQEWLFARGSFGEFRFGD